MSTKRRRSSHLLAVGAMLAGVLAIVGPAAANPASVTIAGNLQSELGCPGDWQPDCDATDLTLDAEDDVWQEVFTVPAGNWEYKAPLNDSWDENYGLGAQRDGPNIPLALTAATDVKFYYDHATHWITDNVNSVIATVPGSFQSELGCSSDWDPGCLRSWLQDPDGDGVGGFATSFLAPGAYEAKVAINESWDENYGSGGVANGPNIPFTVENFGDAVTFAYDFATHVLTIDVVPVTPVDDAALVRAPVRHPFTDEILYFAIPDRFNDGNPTNNCGAYVGPCVADDTQDNVLTHGYLPSDKGYYHGGDLEGLRRQLPYLQNLGVTAVWVGPIYENKTVQPDSTNLYGMSSGYHGYWILDFLEVDPHLGTNAEFARLVDEAHERDIKVFMDVVTNHTADVIQLEGNAGYRNKIAFPYSDVNGDEFDDSDFAYSGQPDYTFPEVDTTSFPYLPVVPADEEATKNPAWLNDPLLYHNRGNSSFVGENSLYGDFFGLDDLWTERREVVEGMIEIFSWWIEEFGVDGFRIDTTKHVNVEFWQKFGPDILARAHDAGIADFFAFGEVFDQQFGPPFLSYFSTAGELQSTIDFAFQMAARDFASLSGSPGALGDFFAADDYYIDADSNAYSMPTFLGNHDMGRIGYFLQRVDQVGASDDELLARSQLAHALMYFSRGQPVIYYGDEQGFTGDGGDKDAREDMFANPVPVYEDNDLIGTAATTSDDNFDRQHPLYDYIRELGKIYKKHAALRSGAQIHRYSDTGPGIYAFSRIDRDERTEFVVAMNNSTTAATAMVPTYSPDGVKYQLESRKLVDGVPKMLTTGAGGMLEVEVPSLAVVIYQSKQPAPLSTAAPGIQITSLTHGQTVALETNSWDGQEVLDRIEIAAELDSDQLAEVTFAVRVGAGEYEPIGTDDNPPYRVFYNASHLQDMDAAPLSFRAIVSNLAGNLAAAEVVNVGVEFPAPGGPANPYAVVHYQRPGGDYGDHTTGDFNDFWGLHLWGNAIDVSEGTDWPSPKPFLGEDDYGRFAWIKLADDTQPVNFIVHRGDTKDTPDDRGFVPADSPEIWLNQDDATVYTFQADAQGYVTVRYHRDDGDYGTPSPDFDTFWGLHLWGDAIDLAEATAWTSPKPPDGIDDFGAFWTVDIVDSSQPLNYIIHRGDLKDPGPDESFTPADTATVWKLSGDDEIYPSRGAAEGFATFHYHRPDGDFGDPTSPDFNDFWGLHVWTGAATPTDWPDPVRPVDSDLFGVEFRVPLLDAADQLAYIIHRGDTKDPGSDQFLVFADWAHEVWQIQGANPEHPYVAPPRR